MPEKPEGRNGEAHPVPKDVPITNSPRALSAVVPVMGAACVILITLLSFVPAAGARVFTLLAAVLAGYALYRLVQSNRGLHGALGAGIQRQEERDRRDLLIDESTGLGNQTLFDQELEREARRSQRHGNAVTLALIDADSYGSIAAQYGHAVAERMLGQLAGFLGGRRAEDRTFRLEGGRFAIILPYTTAVEIMPLMEHLRGEAEMCELGTTVSIGVAGTAGKADALLLRQQAAAALMQARSPDGNAVVAYGQASDDLAEVS